MQGKSALLFGLFATATAHGQQVPRAPAGADTMPAMLNGRPAAPKDR